MSQLSMFDYIVGITIGSIAAEMATELEDLQTVVLESNGKISVLPLSTERPVTPKDLNITPPEDKPVIDMIIDGQIMKNNLKYTGNNENWLNKQLHAQGFDNISEIFLATCDNENNLSVYQKINKKMSRDIFE